MITADKISCKLLYRACRLELNDLIVRGICACARVRGVSHRIRVRALWDASWN